MVRLYGLEGSGFRVQDLGRIGIPIRRKIKSPFRLQRGDKDAAKFKGLNVNGSCY